MIEIKAPAKYKLGYDPVVFLAGSIEMGKATLWQDQVVTALSKLPGQILNPRRDDFDPAATQEANDPYFSKQVNWELDGIEDADVVLFYFDPATKSPVSLLELGLVAGGSGAAIIVCCPRGFWRRGNVEILCERNGIRMVDTLEDLIHQTKRMM